MAPVIYPHCISVVSSQQTKLCDKSATALAKTCSKAWWCGHCHQGRLEGWKVPLAGNLVKLQDFTLRCPNLSKKATKDHNWPQLPRTLGMRRMQACCEMRTLYVPWEKLSFFFFMSWDKFKSTSVVILHSSHSLFILGNYYNICPGSLFPGRRVRDVWGHRVKRSQKFKSGALLPTLILDCYTVLGNCPPTPPLSQHFALSLNIGLGKE